MGFIFFTDKTAIFLLLNKTHYFLECFSFLRFLNEDCEVTEAGGTGVISLFSLAISGVFENCNRCGRLRSQHNKTYSSLLFFASWCPGVPITAYSFLNVSNLYVIGYQFLYHQFMRNFRLRGTVDGYLIGSG